MSRVHSLDHIDCLAPSYFSYNYPVRPHAQGGPDQIADADRAAALDVRVSRLQPYDVFYVPDLQFSGVLDRDDPFRCRNIF